MLWPCATSGDGNTKHESCAPSALPKHCRLTSKHPWPRAQAGSEHNLSSGYLRLAKGGGVVSPTQELNHGLGPPDSTRTEKLRGPAWKHLPESIQLLLIPPHTPFRIELSAWPPSQKSRCFCWLHLSSSFWFCLMHLLPHSLICQAVYSKFLVITEYPEKHSPSFSFTPETVHLKKVFMPFSVLIGLFRLKRTHIYVQK